MSNQVGLWKRICKFIKGKDVSDGRTRKRKDKGEYGEAVVYSSLEWNIRFFAGLIVGGASGLLFVKLMLLLLP